ncbi:PPOX class F420-dependent oxidoreductase [Herbidospora daliensis]|uniref:PPOX class F420-dependent oxidoreductase n=1 Tax=Herbidospora daliensis TaxID=295585 RepID=UPI0007827E27|nr:PPOX class F420-dependent oxidoreductase [Herbidospora daliensis]
MSFEEFWTERHLCTLTTLRADGTPHVVPVGVTLDGDVARVITYSTSQKVRNVQNGGGRVAVCQVDGARWSTLEGVATVNDDPEAVALAVRLYAARYREPKPNPLRVVIEIKITRELGNVRRD